MKGNYLMWLPFFNCPYLGSYIKSKQYYLETIVLFGATNFYTL